MTTTEMKKRQRRLQEIADLTTQYQKSKAAYFRGKTRSGASDVIAKGETLMKVQATYGQRIITDNHIKLRVDQAKQDLSSGMFDHEVTKDNYINKNVSELMQRLTKMKVNNAAKK